MSLSTSTSASASDEDFLCLYLDDFCEEIEVEAEDDRETCSQVPASSNAGRKRGKSSAAVGGSKRKRKTLNKEEKVQVMLSICDVGVDDVLSYVRETVSNEKHIIESSAKKEFWTCLQSSEHRVIELLHTLASLVALLYKACDKGKDKYMKFQLEWYQCCSVFLLPPGKSLS